MGANDVLRKLRESVTGIDVHPVAVHLARSAWVLAAQPAIQDAVEHDFAANVTVPIYLGDALQLRFRTGDMFAERNVTVQVQDERNTQLVFPVSLVKRAETFDALMGDVADAIETGGDPSLALEDNHITDPAERRTLEETIADMRRLHSEGRNHIWAYYTRNLVRPVALSQTKVDVIVGNPPWLNYNQTISTLRTELERQSKEDYGIWTGGRYATNQDVAGLFFARCVDLYLKVGSVIGMVMPHSALQTGQYAKWRTGAWQAKLRGGDPSRGRRRRRDRTPGRVLAVDFGYKTAWELERLEPNTFFPVPASVVFAKNLGIVSKGVPLAGEVERWLGKAGAPYVKRTPAAITDTSASGVSPYEGYSRQGATVVPRCLHFVNEIESAVVVRAGQTITVNPRRGTLDKDPWRSLDLTAITEQAIDTAHVFDVHLGETLLPYATLVPLKAVLPLRRGGAGIPTDPDGPGGVSLGGLERRMRDRWQTVNRLWDKNKATANRLKLSGRLDYHGELSAQLGWQQDQNPRPTRIIYNQSGAPTAALVSDSATIVDYTLYWVTCRSRHEAQYLLSIINSDILADAVRPLMAKGQFGARHLQKHLWKLPIPEFDPANPLHAEVSDAGKAAAKGAARQLAALQAERDRVTVTIARRELRKWLRNSPEGQSVEQAVTRLLAAE